MHSSGCILIKAPQGGLLSIIHEAGGTVTGQAKGINTPQRAKRQTCYNDYVNHRGREDVMNAEQFKGQWRQIKGEIRKQWGKLTDDELDRIAGEKDVLVGTLQKKYGITKEEAEKQVKDFTRH